MEVVVEEEQQLTRTQALIEAVLPECQTLDRLCIMPAKGSQNGNAASAGTSVGSNALALQSSLDDDDDDHGEEEQDTSPVAPHTDLSDPSRRIWVVTTAALPWRTGTSVNPLARALYLTDHRPKGFVTLMVPFVRIHKEQQKIFPAGVLFDSPADQETWIRTYCAERVHCPERADRLNIRFYEATYNPSFASIFATEDICALVPKEHAHICILEEPEHLNWMRIVNDDVDNDEQQQQEEEEKKDVDYNHDKTNEQDTTTTAATTTIDVAEMNQLGWQAKFDFVVGILHTNYDAYVRQYGMGAALLAASALHALSGLCTRAYCHRVIRLSDTLPTLDASKEVTCNVHGVLMEFLQEPPLSPSSPTTTTITETTPMSQPKLCHDKEEDDDPELASIYFIGKLIWAKGFGKLLDIQELFKSTHGQYFAMDIYGSGPDDQAIQRAFFGRKGILEATPNAIDGVPTISATEPQNQPTPDRTAHQIFSAPSNLRDQLVAALSGPSRALAPPEQEEEIPIEVVWDDSVEEPVVVPTPSMEQKLVLVSQRKEQQQQQQQQQHQQLQDKAIHVKITTNEVNDDSKKESTSSTTPEDRSIPEEAVTDTVEPSPPSPITVPEHELPMPLSPTVELTLSPNSSVKETMEFPNPFSILSELSSQFVGTGFFATKAVSKIGQNTVGFGLNALSSEQSPSESNSEVGSDSETNVEVDDEKAVAVSSTPTNATVTPEAPSVVPVKKSRRLRLFDPIKSRFELRRYPVPARFMGMKDHAVLKQVTKHKIFLNPSKSEVLCTTSAEALAMGKFVILPKHPSNTFFLQFENCLAYETKKDCVEKIRWALENDPKPLSEQERYQLTWEGANERLFKAAAMTERQVEDWKKNREASDVDAARLHYETIRRGRGVQKLLHRSSSILSKKSQTSNGSNGR